VEFSVDLMWEACKNNNGYYDGAFYYGVKTTGIFCRPSCKSKLPKRENVEFFRTVAEALQEGYRSCKRCRPEIGQIYDPQNEMIEAARRILQSEYSNPSILQQLPARLGVSTYHLQRLFKKNTSYTLKEYLQRVRVRQAAALLVRGEKNNTDICMTVGFQSFSSFYSVFRRQVGLSPRQAKKANAIKQVSGDD